MLSQQFQHEGCATLSSCPTGELVPRPELAHVTESFDSLHIENDAVFLLNVSQRQGLVCMFAGKRNHLDSGVLPLWNAIFCLDCEVISSSRGDECPACKSRSLVSLARMLGGSLLAHKAQHSQEREGGLFDITITVELQQMHAKDLSTTVERLTSVIGPKLAGDRASFHLNVRPAVDQLDLQPSLCFAERNAA
jgi:hypothetical protein